MTGHTIVGVNVAHKTLGGLLRGHTIVGVNLTHKTLGRVNDRSHDSWRQCPTQNIGEG